MDRYYHKKGLQQVSASLGKRKMDMVVKDKLLNANSQ